MRKKIWTRAEVKLWCRLEQSPSTLWGALELKCPREFLCFGPNWQDFVSHLDKSLGGDPLNLSKKVLYTWKSFFMMTVCWIDSQQLCNRCFLKGSLNIIVHILFRTVTLIRSGMWYLIAVSWDTALVKFICKIKKLRLVIEEQVSLSCVILA